MTYRELRRKLESLGCRFERQADGSHEICVNPANSQRTPILRHGNRDLATGTLHRIRRNLGMLFSVNYLCRRIASTKTLPTMSSCLK